MPFIRILCFGVGQIVAAFLLLAVLKGEESPGFIGQGAS